MVTDPHIHEYAALLDPDVPVADDDGAMIPASEALLRPPSQPMYQQARAVRDWLVAREQRFVDVVAAYDRATNPGGLMVRWMGNVTPEEVAAEFGPIPVWMELMPDDTRDFRFIRDRHPAGRTN